MEIKERKRKNNNLREITVLDEFGNQVGIKNVLIDEAKGNVINEGTPITEEIFKGINWKDNGGLVFKNLGNDELPEALDYQTQIVATSLGDVWVIPKLSNDLKPFKIIEGLEPCILGVVEYENVDGQRISTGLKINEEKKLVIKKAGEIEEGENEGEYGSVAVVNRNGLSINKGILSISKAERNKLGTVSVTSGNGLNLDNQGNVSMARASNLEDGALAKEDKEYIDEMKIGNKISDYNEALVEGIYRGINALNGPTNDKYLCITKVYNNIINQRLINLNTGNVYKRRKANNYWTSYKISDNEGVMIYDSVLNIGLKTAINLGFNLYNNGVRKLKITMYKVYEEYEDITKKYYDNNLTKEVIIHEYNKAYDYDTRISFTQLVGVDSSNLYYIEGLVEDNRILLSSMKRSNNNTINTNQSDYRVIVEAYK